MRLYKYRQVDDDLSKDHALDALLNSYAILSSRTIFNDPFDSKVHIPPVSPAQVEGLLRRPDLKPEAEVMRRWVSAGEFTPLGIRTLNAVEKGIENLIDRYAIYCLSEQCDIQLQWAHYAKAHTGFCIEFQFPDPQPRKVTYREKLASVPMLTVLESQFLGGRCGITMANRIHAALHVKKMDWKYEREHRIIAGDAMGDLPAGAKWKKQPYDPGWVKSIIFGYRTTEAVKSYIRRNLPYETRFRQAILSNERIAIMDC